MPWGGALHHQSLAGRRARAGDGPVRRRACRHRPVGALQGDGQGRDAGHSRGSGRGADAPAGGGGGHEHVGSRHPGVGGGLRHPHHHRGAAHLRRSRHRHPVPRRHARAEGVDGRGPGSRHHHGRPGRPGGGPRPPVREAAQRASEVQTLSAVGETPRLHARPPGGAGRDRGQRDQGHRGAAGGGVRDGPGRGPSARARGARHARRQGLRGVSGPGRGGKRGGTAGAGVERGCGGRAAPVTTPCRRRRA